MELKQLLGGDVGMSAFHALILGIVQGITEFLPISSSGHLSLLQNLFHMQTAEDGHMLFDVLLHLGTIAAVVVFYRKDISYLISDTVAFVRESRDSSGISKSHPGSRLLLLIIFGTVPLLLILPFYKTIEQLYYNTVFIGIAFILNGFILFVSSRIIPGKKNEKTSEIKDALIIGLCQAIATIPGISRSGSTITAGIATGHSRSYAMKYSLLLSVPAVLGANFLSLIHALSDGVNWEYLPGYILGTVVAFAVGYFSIMILHRTLKRGTFGKFSYYMWAVGLLALIISIL